MKIILRMARWMAALAMLLAVLTLFANGSATVPDKRLVGQWQGENQFCGMSRDEVMKKQVAIQSVKTALNISADGSVAGRVGGAELSGCVVAANRGWLGRRLHLKTDFIIRGKTVGAVTPGSDAGIHLITAPFNLNDTQIVGSMFVIRGALTYPYPFLKLRLNH